MLRLPILILAFALTGFAQSGSFTGTVIDDQGKPVSGARVSANISKLPAGTKLTVANTFPAQALALTDAQGRFEIDHLLDGDFRLCADLSGATSTLLNSCLWSTSVIPVQTIKNGATSKGVVITMRHGVELYIRISDPAALFVQHPEKDDLDVGVLYGPASFIPAMPVGRDSGGKTLRLVVLPSMRHDLQVRTKAANVEDQNHNLLTAGSSISIAAPAVGTAGNAAAPNATFRITGFQSNQYHP